MNPHIRDLLEKNDEPGAYEAPTGFRYLEMEAKAQHVARRLKEHGVHLTFEGAAHNQDASFSVALLLHDYEQTKNQLLYQPTIRFSNFGNLASVTWSDQIPKAMIEEIVSILNDCGFTFIPEAELDCPYDGIMPDKKTFSSWWIRYFDWI